MNEQELRRILADADAEVSFVDESQLGIRESLLVKRRQTAYRATVFATAVLIIVVGWRATVSHKPNAVSPVVVESDFDTFHSKFDEQRFTNQLATLRESLAQERRKIEDLNRKLSALNNSDFDVAESTSLVDVSYAFHLQNTLEQKDLAAKEFERITRDCPGTSGAKIAAESLIAFRQP